MSEGGFLRLEGLWKSFGQAPAVRDVSLKIEKGESLALLGPSGSGKTTLLRMLAGFEVPDAGRIWLDGSDVTALAPQNRRFGMVFQHYALFPHLDVLGNVSFGIHELAQRSRRQRVSEMLELVGLGGFEDRRVDELSGGQQQRVALARALAPSPPVLLLDEPLSNLDPSLRERTRIALRRVVDRVGITTVLVTHEQEEAFDLGDRVAVLRRGGLEQVAEPEELYQSPSTRFVANFIGRASVLPATMVGPGRVRLSAGHEWSVSTARAKPEESEVDVTVRPEGLVLVPAGEGLEGIVRDVRYRGSTYLVRVELTDGATVEVATESGVEEGAVVAVEPSPGGPVPLVWSRAREPVDA